MTIATNDRVAGPFDGDDVTVLFSFANIKAFNETDIVVILTDDTGVDTTQVLTTDYTVSLNQHQDVAPGGTVTMNVAPATNEKLTVTTAVPYTQAVKVANQGGFYPAVLNDVFDKLTILIQQVLDATSRSLKIPVSDGSGITTTIPTAALRADRVLQFDSLGNVEAGPTGADIAAANAAAISAAADAAQTALDVIATNADAASTAADAATALSASESIGFKWQYDNDITMADPTANMVRLNNADMTLVTAIAISDNCNNTGNADVSPFVLTWDDSTNPIKGTLLVRELANPDIFAVYSITGTTTDNAGWSELAVTYVDGVGTFTDTEDLMFTFTRSGDDGNFGVSTPREESFVAGAAQTNFTLSFTPTYASVWINGLSQDASTWSISGNDIVVAARTAGDTVEVHYLETVGGVTANIINELGDVDTVTSAPNIGETLEWDGTNWVPAAVADPSKAICSLRQTSGVTAPTSTATKLDFSTVIYDPTGIADTGNDRIIPDVAGWYRVSAETKHDSITVGLCKMMVYKNGSEVYSSEQHYAVSGNGEQKYQSSVDSPPIEMNGTTDYLEIFWFHANTTNRNTNNAATENHFTVQQV